MTYRSEEWTFIGSDFQLGGGGHMVDGPYLYCIPCAAGTTVSLSSRTLLQSPEEDETGTIFEDESTIFAGRSYPDPVVFRGTFNFISGSAAAQIGATERRPFTFTGVLAAYATADATTPLFSSDFVGSGTATLLFRDSPGRPGAVEVDVIRYDFENAAATPEPASLLLIGTGLAGAVAARRRRQRTI